MNINNPRKSHDSYNAANIQPIFLCSQHGPLTEARLPQCPYCYDALVTKYEALLEELRAIQQSPQYEAIRATLETL